MTDALGEDSAPHAQLDRNVKHSIIILSVLTLTACVLGSRSIALPDGRQGHSVRCNGNPNGWGDCMNQAAEVCDGGPYDVYARDPATGRLSLLTGNQSNLQGYKVSTRRREMIFSCVLAKR